MTTQKSGAPKGFLTRKVEVDEPDAVRVFSAGAGGAGIFDPRTDNVFLIGPRAGGKTTLGRKLAGVLNMRFVDTDNLVEEAAGQSIAEIVAEKGWQAFRRQEAHVLARVAAQGGQVVATGGGIVLLDENRALLSRQAVVCYLMADAATLMERLKKDARPGQRPALTDLAPADEVVGTLMEREPLYMSTAHHVLRAEKPLDGLLAEIREKLSIPF